MELGSQENSERDEIVFVDDTVTLTQGQKQARNEDKRYRYN